MSEFTYDRVREGLGELIDAKIYASSGPYTVCTPSERAVAREHVLAVLESADGDPLRVAELVATLLTVVLSASEWLSEVEEIPCRHSELDACECTPAPSTRRQILWG